MSIKSFGTIGMGRISNALRVVIDTNVLVSAIVFGGIPKQILTLVLDENITGVATRILVAELIDVLSKKFHFSPQKLADAESLIQDSFLILQPERTISLLDDDDDNRVLEAAVAGACDYIVTGDKDLLRLKEYKEITIVTAAEFISILEHFLSYSEIYQKGEQIAQPAQQRIPISLSLLAE